MYATSSRVDHYLTYATLIDELRKLGFSIRQSRVAAEGVRNGTPIEFAPSYVSGTRVITYNVDDSTYLACR